MKRILVINAGQSQKNHVFKRISELEYHVTVLNPYILKDIEGFVDDWILSDLSDIPSCTQKITQQHHKEKFDGILTFWEEDVLLAAEITEKLGLPGIDFALAQKIRNKYLFRKLCKEKEIITPKFLYLQETTSLQEIQENMVFPCILKPVYGACSAFVRKCYSAEETLKYYKETLKSEEFQRETELGNVRDLFLESYIGGQEIDIDMLVQDGEVRYVSVIDNFFGENDFFIELGQQCPSHFFGDTEENIKKQAIEIVLKLGIQNACLHFEGKIEKEELIPLEINMRMGGDEIWYSNRDVYGVDLVEQSIKIFCGEKVENYLGIYPSGRVISEDILSEKSGYVRKIEVDENELKKLGVLHYGVLKKIGSYIAAPPEDFSYIGWYMVGKDISDSDTIIPKREAIHKCFHIEIEEK